MTRLIDAMAPFLPAKLKIIGLAGALAVTSNGVLATELVISKDFTVKSNAPIRIAQNQAGTQSQKSKTKKTRGPVRLGTQPRRTGITQPTGGTVQVQTLSSVDPASIGSLSPDEGGFPVDMWRGISRRKLIDLIPYLPAGSTSPAVRSLFRRLLMTRATAPRGTAANATAYLAVKVRKLAEAGYLADVEALVRQIPPSLAGEDLLDARLDALLLSGDTATACKLAIEQVQQTPSARWNKKVAFCHALRGDVDRAELLEGRLQEQDPEDKSFFALLNSLIDPKARPIATLERVEPLYLAMLRATQRPIPPGAFSRAGPAALGFFATLDKVATEERRLAALEAHKWGLIDNDALRLAFTISGNDENEPRQKLRKKNKQDKFSEFVKNYDQLRLRAADVSNDTQRMTALTKIYGQAQEEARLNGAIALFEEMLSAMQPASERADIIELAIRSHLRRGDKPSALKWVAALEQDPSDALEPLRRSLAPHLILAGPDARKFVKRGALNRWWLNELAVDNADRFQRGTLIATLFEALGERTPSILWRALYDGPNRENNLELAAALRRDLIRAANARRLGETVLIALIALQDDGLARLGANSLADIVTALIKVGLKDEAYALTSEVLLQRNI